MSDLTLIALVKRLTQEERQALVTEARGDVAEAERQLQQATNLATAYRGHRDVLTAAIGRVAADEQKAAAEAETVAAELKAAEERKAAAAEREATAGVEKVEDNLINLAERAKEKIEEITGRLADEVVAERNETSYQQ